MKTGQYQAENLDTIALDLLDHLLAALLRSPRDAAQIAVIADWLDESGHPAAAWWRQIDEIDFIGQWIFCYRQQIIAGANDPGVADLRQRLDRLAALDTTVEVC
jgi:uncharacterized protein (TIGR02996 family)